MPCRLAPKTGLHHDADHHRVSAGVPLVYELDKNLKPIAHPDAIPPLSARYLGDVSGIRARIEAVKAQTQTK